MVRRGIHQIITCPNEPAQDVLVRVLEEVAGIVPIGRRDTESAFRVYYPEAISRTIINVGASNMHGALGLHTHGIALEVENPLLAARMAQRIFKEAGMQSSVHQNIEPEDPHIVFLTVFGFPGRFIVFWPPEQDESTSLSPMIPWDDLRRSA